MKYLIALLFSAFFLLAGCERSPAKAADTTESAPNVGDIAAVVNGVELPESRITIYAQIPQVTEQQRKQIIDNMVLSEIISQQAETKGFADKQDIRDQIAVARQAILGRAYASDFLNNHPISPEQEDALYQAMIDQLSDNKEYQAAHILVEDEEKATELLAQINENPDSFANLAQEHSADPGSGANGGELGWVTAQSLVPEFGEAMQALKKGETSKAPVQTTYGWHIIRVNDVRDIAVPELTDELREQLKQQERAKLFSEHVESLRADAKVEIK